MNLDLLIKLVKLANNNPNDNEANLAARKVCKMIAEGDYKFTTKLDPKVRVVSNPTSPDFDWLRKYYHDEFFRGGRKNPWGDPFKEAEEANRKRSKTRKCNKCGLEADTYNMKDPFICFACQYL